MKDKILTYSFIVIIAFFPLYSFILKDESISYSERRKLSTFPKFTIGKIFNGDYFEELNDYFVDNFPFRDEFRNLKGLTSTKLFHKAENNGVFIKNDIIYQLNPNVDKKSIEHFTNTLTNINNTYLHNNKNIYYSVIPDKNYYLKDNKIPKLDYEKIFKELNKNLPKSFNYIDITDSLSLDSYYKTDIHWKQESLKPVVEKISTSMNIKTPLFPTTKETFYPFYGALYGRIASLVKPDTITYLSNETINNMEVYNYEKSQIEKIYQKDYLNHIDSYDIFLSGATPLLIINNPSANNNRELIIFRDSFGSSITPILAESYKKVTLIDLRYINSSLLKDIEEIKFNINNQDILFLYSIPVINDSFALK